MKKIIVYSSAINRPKYTIFDYETKEIIEDRISIMNNLINEVLFKAKEYDINEIHFCGNKRFNERIIKKMKDEEFKNFSSNTIIYTNK